MGWIGEVGVSAAGDMGEGEKIWALAGRFMEQFPATYPGPLDCRMFYDLYGERMSDAEGYAMLLHGMRPKMAWSAVLEEVGQIVGGRMTGEAMEKLGREIYQEVQNRERGRERGKRMRRRGCGRGTGGWCGIWRRRACRGRLSNN